jgi:O-methyltransferase
VILRYTDGLRGQLFYLYDLFNPSGGDGEGQRLPAYSDDLHERARRRLAGFSAAIVTRGKLPEVLAKASPANIAFLHIDMNNADAELGALEALFDRVVTGGIIVFDDCGRRVYGERKRQEDAFAARRNCAILELPTGQGLLIKR